ALATQRLSNAAEPRSRRDAVARNADAFSRHNSGDRKEKSSGGLVGSPEPGTFRYAVGLGIPWRVARLQSPPPLPQARDYRLSLPRRFRKTALHSFTEDDDA